MSNLFENFNFSIENYLSNSNNLERLNKINNYLNFALKATILNQGSNYDIKIQKSCSKQLLLNYILGDKNAFTRGSQIRSNMNEINMNNIIDLLIKSSIELDCYNRNVLHLLDDTLCSRMTNEIYLGKYEEIINMILNDTNTLIQLIDDYIELKYQKDNIFNDRIDGMCINDSLTSGAMNQLNLGMKLYEQKIILGSKNKAN